MSPSPRLLFTAICLVWGTSWLASKVGLASVPPLLFAGLRFLLAGIVMVGWGGARGGFADRRLWTTALIGVAGANALIFWGLARVPSGVAGLINLSLIPIGLYLFGRIAGVEPPSRRRAGALAVGVAGLAVLMAPVGVDTALDPVGIAAVAGGTLMVPIAALIGRPAVARVGPWAVNGVTSLIGGVALLTLSLAFETPADGLQGLMRSDTAVALAYLVIAGSLLAYTAYWRLLAVWGPGRTGAYAFVSPLIALAVGSVVLDEAFGPRTAAGAVVLLAAAWLALSTDTRKTAKT